MYSSPLSLAFSSQPHRSERTSTSTIPGTSSGRNSGGIPANAVAYVGGQPMPAILTPKQLNLFFPQGVPTLYTVHRNAADSNLLEKGAEELEYVFPDEETGNLHLQPSGHYFVWRSPEGESRSGAIPASATTEQGEDPSRVYSSRASCTNSDGRTSDTIIIPGAMGAGTTRAHVYNGGAEKSANAALRGGGIRPLADGKGLGRSFDGMRPGQRGLRAADDLQGPVGYLSGTSRSRSAAEAQLYSSPLAAATAQQQQQQQQQQFLDADPMRKMSSSQGDSQIYNIQSNSQPARNPRGDELPLAFPRSESFLSSVGANSAYGFGAAQHGSMCALDGEELASGMPTQSSIVSPDSASKVAKMLNVQPKREGKVILDRVHGHLQLPMVVFDIIDTKEFQHLRSLKQLGTAVYLYPGATHTRFEHCIGVAHLAAMMVKCLKERQPELDITDKDITCVTIAGLCHDLGHGPFSHLFEDVINRLREANMSTAPHGRRTAAMPVNGSIRSQELDVINKGWLSSQIPAVGERSRSHASASSSSSSSASDDSYEANAADFAGQSPESVNFDKPPPWSHEQMSILLIRRIFEKVDYKKYDLTVDDIRFVELCVLGISPEEPWPSNVGRGPEKRFLLDVVANKRNGIDVDKLDYFMRDSLCCYGRSAVDVHIPRLFSSCRVMCFEKQFQICFEEKMALSLGDIFTVRAKLHKNMYRHRICVVIDHMVSDMLLAADPHFLIRASKNRLMRISECVDDLDGFCQLGDWILNAVAASTEPNLEAARTIIDRIDSRRLYSIAGMVQLTRSSDHIQPETIKEDLLDYIRDSCVRYRTRKHNGNRKYDKRSTTATDCGGSPPRASIARSDVPQTPTCFDAEEEHLDAIFDGMEYDFPSQESDTRSRNKNFADRYVDSVRPMIEVSFIKITYGSTDKNGKPDDPINNVTFYNPKNMSAGAFKLPTNRLSPLFSPSEFGEKSVIVIVREKKFLNVVMSAFDKWRKRNETRLAVPVPTHNLTPRRTTKTKRPRPDQETETLY